MTDGLPEVRTPRLRLVGLDDALMELALYDPAALGEALGLEAPPDWPTEALRPALPAMLEDTRRSGVPPGWSVWVLARDGRIVGDAGFVGPPDSRGEVEVGYAMLPRHRGQGLMTEAVRALAGWAFAHGARVVVALTEPDNAASRAVLRRVGARVVASGSGLERWELRAPGAQGTSMAP